MFRKCLGILLLTVLVFPFGAYGDEEVSTEAETMFDKGWDSIKSQEYDKAKDNFKTAVKKSPDFAEAYYGLGAANLYLKKYEEAKENFSEAIKVNENFGNPYYGRGITKIHLKDYDGAEKDLEVAKKAGIEGADNALSLLKDITTESDNTETQIAD